MKRKQVSQIVNKAARKKMIPPIGMDAAEQFVWNQMVAACSPDHFVESDTPLMVMYCQTFVQFQRAMEGQKKHSQRITTGNGTLPAHPLLGITKGLAGTMSNLAMRLRLAPSTRVQQTDSSINPGEGTGHETDGDNVDRLFAK